MKALSNKQVQQAEARSSRKDQKWEESAGTQQEVGGRCRNTAEAV